MPLCHVVTFTFTPETSTEWIAEFGSALDGLVAQTSTISYRHGSAMQRSEWEMRTT